MKKKITSFICVVALIITTFSGTVLANDNNSTEFLSKLKAQIKQTADYYAGADLEEIESDSPNNHDLVFLYSNDLYYINKSESDSNVIKELNQLYLNALNELLAAHYEFDIEEYLEIIMALSAMGLDPLDYKIGADSYNIVNLLNTLCNDSDRAREFFLDFGEYDPLIFAKVISSKYGQLGYTGLDNLASHVNSELFKTYYRNEITYTTAVKSDEVSTLGIDTVLDSGEYGYFYGGVYVILTGADDAENAAILAKLNNSSLDTAGKYSIEKDDSVSFLELERVMSSGFDTEYFISCISDALSIPVLFDSLEDTTAYNTAEDDNPQSTITVKEALDLALAKIHNLINEQGLAVEVKYGIHFPVTKNTSLALAATSIYNRLGDADKLYEGLNLLRLNDGSYMLSPEDTSSDNEFTGYALAALEVYYYAKSGLGNLYDLTITDTNINPSNVLQMHEPQTNKWIAGSGEWLVFSSPANFASFCDVMVDGNSIIAGPAQVGEDGASTYATVGGGSLRVESGSTIVSLSPDYLSTVSSGEHTIRIQSANGYAESTFYVETTPQTGDTSNLGLFVALTLAGLGMAVVAVARKAKAER